MAETIVVGVDGSEGGMAALEYAAVEAARRSARLRIVAAWEMPIAGYDPDFPRSLDVQMLDALRVRAGRLSDDALATVKKLQPSVDAEALATQGPPADVLLEQGADADLIVVGRRGLGGLKSLLLGSVSNKVVHHATCPVVVVNQPARAS
jgi:nucleotide-binding universal stress UspA family protein